MEMTGLVLKKRAMLTIRKMIKMYLVIHQEEKENCKIQDENKLHLVCNDL